MVVRFCKIITLCGLVASDVNCPDKCRCIYDTDKHGSYVDCRESGLYQIPSKFPSDSTVIDLSANRITTLKNLPVLDDLVTLNLSNNSIKEIEIDAFDDLDNLLTLYLSHNDIRFIETDVFEWGPERLEVIKLDHNRIEVIQQDLFSELEELEEIDLSHNYLNYIHPSSFRELKKLKELKLNDNELNILQVKWINGNLVSQFSHITLHNNPWLCNCGMQTTVNELHREKETLFLYKTIIEDVESLHCKEGYENSDLTLFDDELKERLLHCKASIPVIKRITRDFEKAELGKPLLLRCEAEGVPRPRIEWQAPNNDIYKMFRDDYEGVIIHYDGTLNLADGIKGLDRGTYKCIATNIHGSDTEEVRVIGANGETYQSDMEDEDDYYGDVNDINECEYDPKLRTLIRSTNPGCVVPIPDLDYMRNVIRDPNDPPVQNIFEKNCPAKCDCTAGLAECSYKNDNYYMASIPSVLPAHVRHLALRNQRIVTLTEDICHGKENLSVIDMFGNSVNDIDRKAFKSCSSLEKLKIPRNKIRGLGNYLFQDLLSLTDLDLSENLITYIAPQAFYGLGNVDKLDLRDNFIRTIDEPVFRHMTSLRFLYLESNQIKTLDIKWVMAVLDHHKIEGIFLKENKFLCDCSIRNLKDHVKDRDSEFNRVIDTDELLCQWPEEVLDRPLSKLNFTELKCGDYHTDQPRHGHDFVMLLLGVLVTCFCYYGYRKYQRHNIQALSHYSVRNNSGENRHLMSSEAYA